MNNVIQIFGDIPLSTVIIFIAAIAFLIGIGTKAYKFIITNHDKHQDREDILQQILSDIKNIQKEQASMNGAIQSLVEKQQEISIKQDEFESQNRTHNLNKLRDRLLQNYRFYTNTDKNPLLAWSEMEKEAFDNLFKDYEELGGNGFMHTSVQPEMEKLNVIPMSDMKQLSELMSSRKG